MVPGGHHKGITCALKLHPFIPQPSVLRETAASSFPVPALLLSLICDPLYLIIPLRERISVFVLLFVSEGLHCCFQSLILFLSFFFLRPLEGLQLHDVLQQLFFCNSHRLLFLVCLLSHLSKDQFRLFSYGLTHDCPQSLT